MSDGARGASWLDPASPPATKQHSGAARPAPTERAGAAWWSDARHDPWRDPTTRTEIVVAGPPPERPPNPLEPVGDPDAAPPARSGRILPAVIVTALLVGVVAGGLGGALGYTYAGRDQPPPVLGTDPGAAPAGLAERPPESMAGVVDRVLPSVVTIRSGNGGGSGTSLGSGFVVSTAGYVITNDHVLGNGSTSVTYHDGTSTPATLVGRDHESDLAVLQVDRPGQVPVQLGDSDTVAVGDPVLAFGSPLALANTVTSGIVSALDRTIHAGEPAGTRYYAAIQTDAAVNQGNSGGPLVDAAGRVVGVNSVIRSVATASDEAANIGLAFAIPINQAKRVAQEIIDTGEARRTVFGAELDQGGRVAGGGVRLAVVVPDGPADEAGLEDGDVLVRFDGRPLEEATDLIALVRKHAPGSVVAVEYRRGTSTASASVTLAADTG